MGVLVSQEAKLTNGPAAASPSCAIHEHAFAYALTKTANALRLAKDTVGQTDTMRRRQVQCHQPHGYAQESSRQPDLGRPASQLSSGAIHNVRDLVREKSLTVCIGNIVLLAGAEVVIFGPTAGNNVLTSESQSIPSCYYFERVQRACLLLSILYMNRFSKSYFRVIQSPKSIASFHNSSAKMVKSEEDVIKYPKLVSVASFELTTTTGTSMPP